MTEQIFIPERQIHNTEWLLGAEFIDYWQYDQVFRVEVCVRGIFSSKPAGQVDFVFLSVPSAIEKG